MVAWAALGLVVLSTAGWAVSVARRKANVVDQLWGTSQIVVAVVCLLTGDVRSSRSWLCAALVTIWGSRLSIHLATRDRHRGEDFRHSSARQRRGPSFVWRSLPEIFWFQLVGGGLVVGLPMFAVVSRPQPRLGWVDAAAVATFIVGFSLEAVADTQLRRFRSETTDQGRVLDTGLWRYSRHPNYFGEVTLWIGIALLGVAAGAWWAILSPVMLFIVITRVTGVAAMDRHLEEAHGGDYERYAATTSGLVPLPKRRARED